MSVGGTSGSGSSGSLNLNLGGVSVNYDLGPSVSTLTAQAQSFLSSRFDADQAFVGQAIYGANNLVSGLTQPLIKGALDQVTFDNSQLPSFYNNLSQQNYNLGIAAVGAEEDTAKASIESSQASAQAAGSGGLCYVTTAVCHELGLDDDCHTLKVLRHFRDTFMLATNVRRAFVDEYYKTAPALCARMNARADGKEYVARLYDRFILPCLISIEGGKLDRAFKIYREMLYTVRAENA